MRTLLPEPLERALAALPQPFTVSEACRVLDTSRRVALPRLQLLDHGSVDSGNSPLRLHVLDQAAPRR
ncbi:hypothetical protein AB0E59_07595 [Lentzea sp. NPDC034063]|uniref:hypothetical protein n=1 Tax=unclassified Lentzea TaxID=2643253 RepID=UPI0033F561E1